jgi:hypothetical protein
MQIHEVGYDASILQWIYFVVSQGPGIVIEVHSVLQ